MEYGRGRRKGSEGIAIAWFDKAMKAMVDARMGGTYDIKKRKLTAIYQFAQAMPVLFVPASHIKMDNKKRKRL